MEDRAQVLARVFGRIPVMDMQALRRTCQGRSARSLFRDLAEVGYRSSYTHAGRYYTLAAIPRFDAHGLWWRQGVGFSRRGTLKETLVELVCQAPVGHTHAELEGLLRIRVHNTLLSLVRDGQLGRESFGKSYLYLSGESQEALKQRVRRREQQTSPPEAVQLPAAETIIAVLVEALHAGQVQVSPAVVVARLVARGVSVTSEQVEQVFARYGVKKTARSPSPPSSA